MSQESIRMICEIRVQKQLLIIRKICVICTHLRNLRAAKRLEEICVICVICVRKKLRIKRIKSYFHTPPAASCHPLYLRGGAASQWMTVRTTNYILSRIRELENSCLRKLRIILIIRKYLRELCSVKSHESRVYSYDL